MRCRPWPTYNSVVAYFLGHPVVVSNITMRRIVNDFPLMTLSHQVQMCRAVIP